DWKSINLGVNLSKVCGSTKITGMPSQFTAHVTLEHGHLRALKPEGGVGPVTVWEFIHTPLGGAPQQVAKQPMTNLLLCTVNIPGNTQPTFTIGSQKVVLKKSAGDVILKNLPDPHVNGHCSTTVPCVDHLSAYLELVDKQFTPEVVPHATQIISPSA